MEERKGIRASGFTLNRHEAPDSFLMDPRPENPNPFPGPTTTTASSGGETTALPPFSLTMPASGTASDGKKKRGRPKKYNPDGTLAVTLSPMPISSSVPLTGDLAPRKRGRGRGRGRSVDSLKYSLQFDSENPGGGIANFVGGNFTPHLLTVNSGEDVTMKIMSFSQQESRTICILSANGAISNVTLHQPMSSGGTLTYEGRFEILSLSGSFTPSENGGTRSRSGGMSVSLAGPDGRVFGGGLAGLFIAAGPVQVIVGSFLVGHEQEHKIPKKQRISVEPSLTPAAVHAISAEELKAGCEKFKPVSQTPVSFAQENPVFANINTFQHYYTNSANDSKESSSSFGEEESEAGSQSDSEIPC